MSILDVSKETYFVNCLMTGIWPSQIFPRLGPAWGEERNVLVCIQRVRESSLALTPDSNSGTGWGRIRTQDFWLPLKRLSLQNKASICSFAQQTFTECYYGSDRWEVERHQSHVIQQKWPPAGWPMGAMAKGLGDPCKLYSFCFYWLLISHLWYTYKICPFYISFV